MKKIQKKPLTLLEIMIVIFLIGIIGSAIGYNMKGSMDKGRAFKSERAKEQIEDILQLQLSEGIATCQEIVEDPQFYIKRSGMAKNPDALLKDGWGVPFTIEATQDGYGFKIHSKKLKTYHDAQNKKNKTATDAATSS